MEVVLFFTLLVQAFFGMPYYVTHSWRRGLTTAKRNIWTTPTLAVRGPPGRRAGDPLLAPHLWRRAEGCAARVFLPFSSPLYPSPSSSARLGSARLGPRSVRPQAQGTGTGQSVALRASRFSQAGRAVLPLRAPCLSFRALKFQKNLRANVQLWPDGCAVRRETSCHCLPLCDCF